MWIKLLVAIFMFPSLAFALDAPTITANAKGPNQINLTWSAVTNPGWGYTVEIQSDGDSRYSTYTNLTALLQNGFGYLPYWVTESHYRDRSDGTGTEQGAASQFQVYGLKHNTLYNFRVRSYGKTDAGVATYSGYSSVSSATTLNATADGGTGIYKLRFVRTDGNNSNNGQTDSSGGAWATMAYAATQVTAGTLVLVHGGTYTNDGINATNSGSYDGTNYDDKIIFQGYPGETAIINSTNTPNEIVYLDQSYWVLDSLTINDVGETSNNAYTVSGNRNVLANITWNGPDFDGGGYTPTVTGDYNTVYNTYLDGYWLASDSMGQGQYRISGDWNFHAYCNITKFGHDSGQMYGSYNAYVNSLMDGGYGMGAEFQVANYNLLEGCLIKEVAMSEPFQTYSVYKPGIEICTSYNTIRRNVIISGDSHAIELNDDIGTNSYNLIYNNTVYGNGGAAVNQMSAVCTYNTFKNNIFYNNTGTLYGTPVEIIVRGTYTGLSYDNNIILHNDNPSYTAIMRSDSYQTVAYADSNWAEFGDNLTTAPTFINAAAEDFHLQSSSYGLALSDAITDATWGSVISEGDSLGAFKYYEIAESSTTSSMQGVNMIGGSFQ